MPEPKTNLERKSTDESLDAERDKTDHEIAKGRADVTEDADSVVRTARARADKVLEKSRSAADQAGSKPGAALQQERVVADAAVSSERATEDKALLQERAARSEALAELFRLERDQTDLYLLTERARSDEEVNTRDTFLAMVAHDLRSMLQGIAITAELMAKDAPVDTGTLTRTRAESIRRFTGRMNRLIGDLVDVATIETGRPLVTPERRDLLRLLEEAEEGLQPVAAAHGILFTTDVVGRPEVAQFDHDRILQVLANLITNAIKFTPEGGRITLRIQTLDGMIQFSVQDTGSGIPADKLEAIFQRFWQVGKKDRRGLGLGLYISKCIVEGHGGRIWAESKPGEGSTLFFTLPQAGHPVAAKPGVLHAT